MQNPTEETKREAETRIRQIKFWIESSATGLIQKEVPRLVKTYKFSPEMIGTIFVLVALRITRGLIVTRGKERAQKMALMLRDTLTTNLNAYGLDIEPMPAGLPADEFMSMHITEEKVP